MTSTGMTVTNGTCAYCQHHGDVIHPGSTLYQCADGKACITRMDAINMAGRPGAGLTRAEDAYAHLASFARGDAVDIESTRACYRVVVMTPLRADGDDLASAYLVVSSAGTPVTITVASLLDSRRAVTRRRGGNVRYFDEAGYAAQNG